jgi:hypothetical protein
MAVVQAIKIQANVIWRAKQSSTSKRWIGVCEMMNLALEADSVDELRSVINEAMHLLFVDLVVDDELTEFLHARGWSMIGGVPEKAQVENVAFDVPWELLVAGNARDSQLDRSTSHSNGRLTASAFTSSAAPRFACQFAGMTGTMKSM